MPVHIADRVAKRPRAAERLARFSDYIFQDLAREVALRRSRGQDVVDLGLSDPDLPPPARALEALRSALASPDAHRYPPYRGTRALRQAVADWYRHRFDVSLDPEREVLITLGSKEALVHLALAFADPGDVVLIPDPGYPAYRMAGLLFGLTTVPVVVDAEHDGAFRLDRVDNSLRRRARLCYLNYPHNPTGRLAPDDLYVRLVDWAREEQVVLVSDLAYADLVYEGRAQSLLQVPDGRPWCLELVTWSKSYSMQGWRVGALVGDADLVAAVAKVEDNINAGVFRPIQAAAAAALAQGPDPDRLARYRTRRDAAVRRLRQAGFAVTPPPAGVYLWIRAPGDDGTVFARRLLDAGVAVAPGIAFGDQGRPYVRLSLTHSDQDLESGMERLLKA
jgi:LL-diaminopimelate aminotransferase